MKTQSPAPRFASASADIINQLRTHLFLLVAPIAFVLVWSTGWIVARFSAPFADPLTFLLFRYGLAILALLPFALLARAAWPKRPVDYLHAAISGVLLHGLYLGGVWWSVAHGVPASISALLAVLQPLLTAALAPALLGEKLTRPRAIGIALGLAGLICVLFPQLANVPANADAASVAPLLVNAGAMLSVTAGTFYQSRFLKSGDLRTATIVQYIGAIFVTLPLALLTEPMRIVWNVTTLSVLAWSVFALSIGAISLLLMLIRRGEVYRSAQLLFLVPPAAALQAMVLFGERLAPVQWAGMALTIAGVGLARRR